MTEKQIKLVIGSLMHDIGKIIYRSGDGRNHSRSGYEYLKNEIGINDTEILHCVLFHHGKNIKNASLDKNDPAFLTYFSDNVAAAADRRESLEQEDGFDREVPLASVFNILNGNQEKLHFARQVLDTDKEMNYPTDTPVTMDEGFYKKVTANITDHLEGIAFTEGYVDSLLSVMEANLSYIPSSTSKREQADISLYDHVKMTAAVALCVEQYLQQEHADDYRQRLYTNAVKSYKEPMFLLYSMDISGIQDFIYTTASKGALKNLRARSFYLEVLMEHLIDELLSATSLSRVNLIYCGGGHCYLLFPNTESVKQIIDSQEKKNNAWFLQTFGTTLYMAGGYAVCSAEHLKNEPQGSYSEIYHTMSEIISEKKLHRYDAKEIRMLNSQRHDGERECEVCRRTSQLDQDQRCPVCAALQKISGGILKQEFFTVINRPEEGALPLPGDRFLITESKESLPGRMEGTDYVRTYTKNRFYTGRYVTTKLWVGDYTSGDTFEEFAREAKGIERIGILRADVDNLGRTFVDGFRGADGSDRFVTISRTSALSRQLSLFFKCYMNKILKDGKSSDLGCRKERRATIVYSGGDDLFLVGAWNDVIGAFIDLKDALSRFSQNTLTISGGIGIYQPGYPVNIMAKETAALEEASKELDGKDAVTLFDEHGTYSWNVFREKVMGEKFHEICAFFEMTEGYGKAFLYRILELLRGDAGERFNRARYVYYLSRMEPEQDRSPEKKKACRRFSEKMYQWAEQPEDRREVITAIYLYIYLTREREETQ